MNKWRPACIRCIYRGWRSGCMPAMVEELPPLCHPAGVVRGRISPVRPILPAILWKDFPCIGASMPSVVEEFPPCPAWATLVGPPVLREASPSVYGGRISLPLGPPLFMVEEIPPIGVFPLPPMVEEFPLCATRRERNGGRISPTLSGMDRLLRRLKNTNLIADRAARRHCCGCTAHSLVLNRP